MDYIDLSLYEGKPFGIKTKSGKEYKITFVPAHLELKLMQEQEDIHAKAGKWKTLEQQDLEKWKSLIIKILNEQPESQEVDEKDISSMRPMDVIAVCLALCAYLTERSKIVYDSVGKEAKEEMEKVRDDIKKKTIEKALQG